MFPLQVSLSNGEAETYGLTEACFLALGVWCGTAVGVAQRRGSGQIRYLEAVCETHKFNQKWQDR